MTFKQIKLLAGALVISTISLNSIQSFAGEDGSPFEGLYAGIAATKSTFDSTVTYLDLNLANTPNNFDGITDTRSGDSYGGGLFVGYGLNYGILYAGAEAAFIIEKGSSTFSDGARDIRFFKSNTLDINLRSGVTISDKALIYGLFGYTGVVLKSRGTNGVRDDGQQDFNKRITGYQYGGGVEIAVMENITARMEYTRAKLNDAVFADGSDQFTVSPKTNRIMFSVVLHMY